MAKQNNFMRRYVFSSIGVIAAAVIFIVINIIFTQVNPRVDMTEEKLYTLSEGTHRILEKLDADMEIRFYYSKDSSRMPMYLKNYARRVQDLLHEFEIASGGRLNVIKKNPSPDSDDEDSAKLDGVTPQLVAGQNVYLGLTVSCIDEKVSFPFLNPEQENQLEYELARAITRVLTTEKPVLGVLSSLTVMGSAPEPGAMMVQPQQQKAPWAVISELKQSFEVKEVAKDTKQIPADIEVLLLIHPSELTDETLFAIDQFVLRGGKLLAYLDSMSVIEAQNDPQRRMQYTPPGASTLGVLLDKWGVEFKTDKVIADRTFMMQVPGRNGQPEKNPVIINLTKDVVNKDDPAIGQLDSIFYIMGGYFNTSEVEGLTKETLLTTSEDSGAVDKYMAQMPGEAILKRFSSDMRKQDLAIRLTGKFKTAFPDGKPASADKKEEVETDYLKEGKAESAVILVGDSDMLYDSFCIQKQRIPFLRQEIKRPLNDNITLAINLLELLSGDSDLISIRSRGVKPRPFTYIQKMQADTQQKYQNEMKILEEKANEAKRKINELQKRKTADQKLFWTPEQKEALAKMHETEVETQKKIRNLSKEYRKDIDKLELKLQLIDSLLMPLLVILFGLTFAVVKRVRG